MSTSQQEITPDERDVVTYQAWYLMRRCPPNVGVDDLISEGYIGLLRARRFYDPSRGVKFTTYAQPAVRGAMLDYLRVLSGSRSIHRPDIVSLTDHANLPCRGESPGDIAEQYGLAISISRAMLKLTLRQRQVLRLRYGREWKYREICAELDITEARAWALHRAAIAKLKIMLGGDIEQSKCHRKSSRRA